jgi:hypothetical protein
MRMAVGVLVRDKSGAPEPGRKEHPAVCGLARSDKDRKGDSAEKAKGKGDRQRNKHAAMPPAVLL